MGKNMNMGEILELHNKISSDPWTEYRIQKQKDKAAVDKLKKDDTENRKLDWFFKDQNAKELDRLFLTQKKEMQMMERLQKEEEVLQIRKNNEQREQILSRLLEKEKNNEMHKYRYSEHLRKNDPTLRELANQLREAYVSKIRLAQIEEKQRTKDEIKKEDIPFVEAALRENKIEQRKEKLARFFEDEKKYLFRKQLDKQVEEKKMIDAMLDTSQEDKNRIEAIIKANMEEMQAEREADHQKKMEVRRQLLQAMQDKFDENERERQRLLKEEERLKQYLAMTDNRSDKQKELKKLREENLAVIQKSLGDLISQKQRDIEEFEAARQDVAIAQAEMDAFHNEKTERENKEKAKQQLIREMEAFKLSKLEDAKRTEEKDRLENEAIQKINEEKIQEMLLRKEKEAEKYEKFKKECQEDILNRKSDKDKCYEEELEMLRKTLEEQKKYDQDVQNERIKMIKEMAPHLYPGCIPRGMLKDKDIQYLDEPLKEFLLNKKPYPDLRDFC